jgi:hypothetical protein
MTHAHHGKSRFAAALCTVLPLVAFSERAWAQPREDEIAAEALFEEGKRLIEQGRIAEACAKFIDSDRFDPDISTEYHLADCFERSRRHASAWLLFRRVASKARAARDVAREERALERAAAVEPKVARLVIQVAPQPGRNKITIMRRRVDQPRSTP